MSFLGLAQYENSNTSTHLKLNTFAENKVQGNKIGLKKDKMK
jgi:hypothetical protein